MDNFTLVCCSVIVGCALVVVVVGLVLIITM